MFKYLRESFRRKKARRITQEYSFVIDRFQLEHEGWVEFANWDNPLVRPIKIIQAEVDFFKKFIQKGDLIIDIGANIGDTTVPMSLAAGAEGITLGFDPNPYVFKILEQNALLNKDKSNIVPIACAITSTEKEFYYISSEASYANGGISESIDSTHGKYVYPDKIKGIVLSDYLNINYPNKKPSFIKIDTEGYDKEIIKSIYGLIAKYKPILIAESFGSSPDEAKKELFDVIDQHGYSLYYFEDFNINAHTELIPNAETMLKWRETINLYALPKK